MNKTVKVSLWVLVLFFTLVTLATVAIVTLDPNDHKEWIAEQFRQRTGRNLYLEGNIDLTLYPWFGLEMRQISIGNRTGFDETPMFRAEVVHFRVKLLPMLRQHYEIDTVELSGVELNLTINEDGVANWADLVSSSDQDPAAINDGSSTLQMSNFVLGGVDVENASLQFENRTNGARYEITNLNFNTDELVYGAPIDLTLSMEAAATTPPLNALVNLNGTVNYDLDNGLYQLSPLSLQANLTGNNLPDGAAEITLTASFSLNLEDDTLVVSDLDLNMLGTRLLATINGSNLTTDAPVYQSDLVLTGSDLAVLFKVAEIEPLATQLGRLDERGFELTASVNLNLSQNNIEVTQLSANLLGAELEGEFEAVNFQSQQPVVRGLLKASGPDLPLVVEVLGQISGGQDSQLSAISRVLGQVSDKAFSVDAEFDADLQTGNVNVTILDVQLLGASINGNLAASNVQSDSLLLNGNLKTEGPDLPLILQIAGLVLGGSESALYQYGEKLSVVGNKSFVANSEFYADIGQGNIEIPQLSVSALGLQIEGTINARNMTESDGTIDGSLTLYGSSLQPLLTAIDQQGSAEVLESLAMTIQLSGTRNNLFISPLQASLVVAGDRIPNSPVTLEINADTRVDLDQETLSVESFSLQGLGLDASGRISASRIFDAPEFEGQLELASFNLRRLLQQLNQPVPATTDDSVLQQVGFNTEFRGSTENIELNNLVVSIDDSVLRGNVTLSDFTELAIKFNLEIDQLDVDRYLPPETTQSQDDTDSTRTEIPREQLANLNVHGQLQANSLSVAGMDFTEFSLTVNAENGQLDLGPISTNLYQGSFEGNFHLSVADAVPVARFDANLRQIDLDLLLLDLMDATYLSGNGNVEITLTSSGSDIDAMINNLNGNGRIELENGVFTGVDVASVLGQVETMLRSRRPAELQRGQQTAFDSFSSTMVISNGVVNTNDLLIMSPGFQVTGRGTLLDLNNETIRFDLITSVDEATATRDDQEFDIGGYSLPIACNGTLSAPRCLPDAGEIIRGVLAREVQRRLGGFLERALGIGDPQPAEPSTDGNQDTQFQQEPEPEPVNPTDDLINRALDRIFN